MLSSENCHAKSYPKSEYSEILSTNLRSDCNLFSSTLHYLWNEYAKSTGVYKLVETVFLSLESEEVWTINVNASKHLICLRSPRKGQFIDILRKFITTLQYPLLFSSVQNWRQYIASLLDVTNRSLRCPRSCAK